MIGQPFRGISLTKLAMVFVIAFVARGTLYVAILVENPTGYSSGDAYGYWRIAGNVLEHQSFSSSRSQPLMPNHFRTPVYPLFLSSLRLRLHQRTFGYSIPKAALLK